MANIGDLSVKLSADVAAFQSKLKDAEKSVTGLKDHVGSQLTNISSGFSKLTAGVGLFTGALAGAGLTAWVKQAIDAADALGKMSDRTGVAVEQLDGLTYAIKMSGGEAGDMEKALLNLNKRISDVQSGDAKTQQIFKQLGITATDAHGAILQLAEAFPKLSAADRARVGTDLLGGSYKALLPLLVTGREGIEALAEEKAKLAPVTEDMARKSAEFNDNLDRLKTASGNLAIELASELLPVLNKLIEGFLKGYQAGDTFFGMIERGIRNAGRTDDIQKQIQLVAQLQAEVDKNAARVAKGLDDTSNSGVMSAVKKLEDARAHLLTLLGQVESKPSSRTITLSATETGTKTGRGGRSPKVQEIGNMDSFIRDLDEKDYLKEVEAARRANLEYQREINRLIADTPTGKLREAEEKIKLLSKAYEEGLITAEQFNEAAVVVAERVAQGLDPLENKIISIQTVANDAAKMMTDSFIDFATSSDRSFEDFARNFLANIGKMILQAYIFNSIQTASKTMAGAGGIIGTIGSALIGSANGNAFENGRPIQQFANGGIISQPVRFPLAGGRTGEAGEAGVEGIFPLIRKNGKLGVHAVGAGTTNNQVINQVTVTVQGGNQDPDQLGQKVADQVVRALVRSEVANQMRSGGLLNGR